MSRVIVLGDTHWGANNGSSVMHSHFRKFYADLIEFVKLNGIKAIIQTGDLFDKRKSVDFLSLWHAEDCFFKPLRELGVKLFVIAGNHDCTYKNTNYVNSVDLLMHDSVTVIDQEPTTVEVLGVPVDFYPWVNEANMESVVKMTKKPKAKIAVGHFEFDSFPMYPGIIAEHGMNHQLFGKYAAVYSGHYHTVSAKDNILYTGTPYELTWGDHDDPKGFWVVDLAKPTQEPEYIQNPHVLFTKIQYDDTVEMEEVDVKDQYVKIYTINKNDQYAFDSYVAKLNSQRPYGIQIVDADIAKAVSTALNSDAVFKSTIEMINHVVDNMELVVEKPKLKSMISEIYGEAMNMVNL